MKNGGEIFFRKCHVLGLLERRLSNMAKANQHYAVMAVYHTTAKGEKAVCEKKAVMIAECCNSSMPTAVCHGGSQIATGVKTKSNEEVKQKSRAGKGGRIVDTLRDLMTDKENWREISCRKDFWYPGVFQDITKQHMLYTPDVTSLKPDSQSGIPDDFMWRDIQLSKGKMNMPRSIIIKIEGKMEKLQYRIAPCAGVKMCPQEECSYIAAIKEHHTCPHHKVSLKRQGDCPVYFVYVEPTEANDKRRWIAGIVLHQKDSVCNLHSHGTPPPSSILSSTIKTVQDAASKHPTLTAQDLMQDVGSGYPVGLTDKAANNVGKVRYQLKKAKGPKLDSATVIDDFESIADEIDQADAIASGECGGATLVETTSEKYRRLGRPYLRSAGIEDGIKSVLVMTPLMAQIVSSAPFIQADITFNETREYPYLFNVTAFDDISMRWMIVCRIRLTKQTHEGYALCFRLMFDKYKKECSSFELGRTLVGIVVDWSDAEAQGLKVFVMQWEKNLLINFSRDARSTG